MGTVPCPSLRSLLEHNSTLHQRLPPVEELMLQRLISSLMAPDTELGFLKERWSHDMAKEARAQRCLPVGRASFSRSTRTMPLDRSARSANNSIPRRVVIRSFHQIQETTASSHKGATHCAESHATRCGKAVTNWGNKMMSTRTRSWRRIKGVAPR